VETKLALHIDVNATHASMDAHAKTPRVSEQKLVEAGTSTCSFSANIAVFLPRVVFVALVVGDFAPEDVKPFARPSSTVSQTDFVFFLSHRGPDTKEALVRPLSFILKEMNVPHFFDQNDEAMQLGKVNSNQMAEAAWAARVGVVVLSDRFAESKWCLRELNTFLLRCHSTAAPESSAEDAKQAASESSASLLVPVYYADHLMSQSKLYYPHIGQLSSILRKSDEASHEFLATLVPRLLSIPAIQTVPSIQAAQAQLKNDPFVVKRLWNQYADSLLDKTENKKFVDPHPRIDHKKDLEVIKSLFKSLVPTDIKAGLEVYQPLEYSLVPFVPNAVKSPKRFSLDAIIVDLLQRNPISLGDEESAAEKDEAKQPEAPRRISTFNSPPASSIKLLLIQGAAGSGKSLFGWHLCSRYYQHAKETKENYAALPIFVSLPMFRSQILSNDASQLLPNYLSKIYGIKDAAPLQDQPLVIILDGLDELGSKVNLYQACHLHLWRNTTFLLTCRSEFLQDSDVVQYITPTNPVNGTAEPSWLGKLYLLPSAPSNGRSTYPSLQIATKTFTSGKSSNTSPPSKRFLSLVHFYTSHCCSWC